MTCFLRHSFQFGQFNKFNDNKQQYLLFQKKGAGLKAKGKPSPKGRGKVDPNAAVVVQGPPPIQVPTEEEVEKKFVQFSVYVMALVSS